MSKAPLDTPHSEDFIHCHIAGVTRTEFLTIKQSSGYPAHYSIVVEQDPDGILMNPRTFQTQDDFVIEHDRITRIAKELCPNAEVHSFYYDAGQCLPKFETTDEG